MSYTGSVITARFITIMARAIISAIGTYYAVRSSPNCSPKGNERIKLYPLDVEM